ncbi:MAG: MarR family transcriptional regulator [Euryarchaeota archaeon]|nr:MarR family transcriptional regulator [Euryarchaeota archaeon]
MARISALNNVYIYCYDITVLPISPMPEVSTMIDFACKEFKISDVIKCALNLTRADMQITEYFLTESDEWFNTDSISKGTGLELSTIQRSVKKLTEKDILVKSQKNLDGGGYSYIYMMKDKEYLKKMIMDIVCRWMNKVEQELEVW